MALIGTSSESWTLHDTTEIDPNAGYIADLDGSFEGKLRNDTTARTIFVKGGVFYPFDLKLAQSTSAVNVTEITIIRTSVRGR